MNQHDQSLSFIKNHLNLSGIFHETLKWLKEMMKCFSIKQTNIFHLKNIPTNYNLSLKRTKNP